MKLEIHFASGFLDVAASGQFSLEDAKRTFLEMLEAIDRNQADKVLFDGRRLTGKPDVMARFYYGSFAANETLRLVGERGLPLAPRFAYVLVEPLRDPKAFGENVAFNRGMIVKTFENREDACAWLGVTPAGKQDAGTS